MMPARNGGKQHRNRVNRYPAKAHTLMGLQKTRPFSPNGWIPEAQELGSLARWLNVDAPQFQTDSGTRLVTNGGVQITTYLSQ